MTKDMLELRKKVRQKKPLIHCITNPISIHACANAVLALGARPIMAEHPKEVAQITATAGALMLNLGNITDVRMESMEISLRTAKENDIPVLLDLVGTACSDLRFRYAKHLMEIGGIAVLKGNTSELLSIADCPSHSIGVDAGEKDAVTSQNQREMANIFGQLSKETGAVILASGKKDMVVSASSVYVLSNGDPMLACITGTGCVYCVSGRKKSDSGMHSCCGIYGNCGRTRSRKMPRTGQFSDRISGSALWDERFRTAKQNTDRTDLKTGLLYYF